MKESDIKKILADNTIPEPDETVKETMIATVMAEFSKQKVTSTKKIKGKEKSNRLMSTLKSFLTYLGESTMKRRYVIPSAVTACLVVLVFGVSQLMDSNLLMEQSGNIAETPLIFTGEKAEEEFTVPEVDESAPAPQTFVVRKEKEYGHADNNKKAAKPSVARNLSQMSQQTTDKGKLMGFQQAPMMDEPSNLPSHYVGQDKFEEVDTNPVKRVVEEPISTFSVDVDTASYAFVRKMLNRGTLPPKDAVRIEELVNYFDYDYPLPVDKTKPFLPTVAVYPTPWNPDTKLLHIGIRGYGIQPDKKPKTNLVFLIDVSGSMEQPDKLPLLKNAFRMLVNTLEKSDTVSIVVYAGAAGTVLEPTRVAEKGKILSALESLNAGGSTAGGEGIRQAYALAEANHDDNGVNRVILATDGDFNVGITNMEELKGFVERKRKTGIFLSVIGFGQGNYNDALMQKLAQNGNGNASYIDNLNEARKVLVQEASATLFAIARDVKIQVEFNPARVAEYRLIGYETRLLKREDFNNDQVDAGDIGSGHRVTAIYEFSAPGSKGQLLDKLRYSNSKAAIQDSKTVNQEYAFLKIRYKNTDSDQSSLMTTPITSTHEFDSLKKVSPDIRFASAVAAYGQLLRQDSYIKDYTYDDVIRLALSARGDDPFGLRNEFINLIRLAKSARALSAQ
ncbi:VWA domain-containing protein [bacterium]|nr:VWA domain-containing protein [bacterium]